MLYIEKDNLIIRPMVVSDLFRIKEIRDLCLNFLHDPRSYSFEETLDWFILKKPSYLTVYYENIIVGYFRLSDITRNSCFVGMDLHPNYRGRQIALRTYQYVMHDLYDIGINIFYLRVLKSNPHAIRLYSYIGFQEVKDAPKYEIAGRMIDDMLMCYKFTQNFTFQ